MPTARSRGTALLELLGSLGFGKSADVGQEPEGVAGLAGAVVTVEPAPGPASEKRKRFVLVAAPHREDDPLTPRLCARVGVVVTHQGGQIGLVDSHV